MNTNETNYKGISETAKRECKHHGETLFRKTNQNKWVCLQCQTDIVVRSRAKRKVEAIIERGGECERCGFDDVRALQWHHTIPLEGNREEHIKLNNAGRAKAKEHYDKYCELLCANCHSIHHADDRRLWNAKK